MSFDPAIFGAIGALVDRYGLPLALMGALAWALFTRRLILGSESERTAAAYEAELKYRDDRRVEERDGRLAAEAALRDLSGAVTTLSDGLEKTTDTILRAVDGQQPRARR